MLVYSLKTLVLRAFPANLYFRPETAEGDVTITSLLVDQSRATGFSFSQDVSNYSRIKCLNFRDDTIINLGDIARKGGK